MPHFSPITLGEQLKCTEVEGFIFTETKHKANQTLSRHYHEKANIAYILSGSFREMLDTEHFECSSQSLVVKPGDEAHANHYGRDGMRCLLIEIQPQRFESLYPSIKALNEPRHVRATMPSMLSIRIYKEMRLMDSSSALAMEGLTLELIAELSRHSGYVSEPKIPRWLEWAKEILHAEFSESLNLTGVAKSVGVHPVHLAREFRRFFNCTPGEYVRRFRIELACRKLSTSDMPLVEISLVAGFAHQSHFSRVFKRHIGVTPTEFRSIYRSSR